MDDTAKQITLQKLAEMEKNLRLVKRMISRNSQPENVVDKIRDQWNLAHDLKDLLKAFSITEKVKQGKFDEATAEVQRF